MKCKCASRSWVLVVSVSTAMLLGSALVPGGQSARAVDWTWMKGRSVANWAGTYGTLGTPASANTPGARDSAVSWTDASGKLWLFGGHGLGTGNPYSGRLNDLANDFRCGQFHGTALNPGAALCRQCRHDVIEFFCHS